MKSGDYQRPSSVQFHSLGLAEFNGKTSDGWKMSTLPEIRQTLGHAQVSAVWEVKYKELICFSAVNISVLLYTWCA